MAYPAGFLFQPSVSLALRPPGPPFSSGVILGPRTEELCRSSSGSAFAPYSSSAASPGFSAHLPYGGEPRAAAALSSFMSPPYDPPYDPPSGLPSLDYHPFGALGVGGPYPPYGDPGYRKNATRDATATLKAWLGEHRKNPYPTKGEKIMLAIVTKMTLTQVSTWFANARRRLKKENKVTWTPRTRSEDEEDEDHVELEEEEEQEAATRRLSDSSVFRGGGDSEPGFSDLDFKDPGEDRTGAPGLTGGAGPGGTLGPLRESERTPPPSRDLPGARGATRGPDPPTKPKLWSLVELATSGGKSKGGRDASEGGGAMHGTALPRHLYYTSAFTPGFSGYAPVRPPSGGAPVRPPSGGAPVRPLNGLQHTVLQHANMAAARDCRLPGPPEPHELQRGAANV